MMKAPWSIPDLEAVMKSEMGAAGPGGVDEGVRVVEDLFEAFPFAGVIRGFL